MKSQPYVRTEMLPEQPAPIGEVGAFGWIHANLFSSWINGILTVVSILLILSALNEVIPWALFYAQWNANSLTECREAVNAMDPRGGFQVYDLWALPYVFVKEVIAGLLSLDIGRLLMSPLTAWNAMATAIGTPPETDGACWAVIRERWLQMLFGFYTETYLRPILAFILLLVALAPILFAEYVPRKLIWFSAIFPFLFPWLLWGGTIFSPISALLGFVIGYVAYRLLNSRAGALVALIVAVVLAAVWWLFLSGPFVAGMDRVSTSFLKNGYIAKWERRIDDFQQQLGNVDLDKGQRDIIQNKLNDANRFVTNARNIDRIKDRIATNTEKATAQRAALPASVSGVHDMKLLPSDDSVSKADREQLEGVIDLERRVTNDSNRLDAIYAEVGRIGLTPVESGFFGGFMLSITIGVVAIAGSLPLGIVLALGRQSDLLIVKSLCIGFIEFIRGVPLITLLFVASTLLNIFLPPGTSFDIILRVLIMVTLFASAYMAEVIRGGLAALPRGQYEAADSLGLDYWMAQRLIIMPQALKISIPGIVSTFIGVFKDTTLVSIIGLLDPLGLTNAIRADQSWNGIVWELYGFIAALFFVICFSMSRYSMYLERKLRTGH